MRDCQSMPYDPKLAGWIRREGEMRRDLDYLREMLGELEASDEWQFGLGYDDESDDKRDYHVELCVDEGLLLKLQPGIYRMTAKGHDFLDHTRDKDIWDKSKAAMGHIKDHSISMLMRVAEGYVRVKVREITGLDI